MKVKEMIEQLNQLYADHGDCEVLITDGFECRCYSGNYEIKMWYNDDNIKCIDIGIGGCLE